MSQTIIKSTKTSRPTKKGMQRQWYILDASKEPLGRIATKAASILTGKNRADYLPDVNMGGMVIIINAQKLVLTGKKPQRKNYFRHSGRIGGLKVRTFAEQMALDPKVPVYKAIKNMLPKNRHQDIRMNTMLRIFVDANHDITQQTILAN
jgi:large subunit ribosomal protein L13